MNIDTMTLVEKLLVIRHMNEAGELAVGFKDIFGNEHCVLYTKASIKDGRVVLE